MNLAPSATRALAGLGLTLLLFTGCRTARPTAAIGISSPPPPLVGSSPIAAYDDYARAVAPDSPVRIEPIAQVAVR